MLYKYIYACQTDKHTCMYTLKKMHLQHFDINMADRVSDIS